MSEPRTQQQDSPLQTERGGTRIEDSVVSKIAGIAAQEVDEAIPAFLTILTLPLTFNISYGIGFGFISYVLIKLARGKPGEVHPLLYGVAILFALAFLVPA